tara:strand:+ start:801 stop:1226 length:426 start_codon:yes stop_codon:yes gene_type:complete
MYFKTKIKRTWTDNLFSKYIRDRAGWKCQHPKCNKSFDKNDSKQSRKLHCCHIGYGRGHVPTRWNEYNCLALCSGCHLWVDSHPFRSIWLLNQHFSLEQILFVKDQYANKRTRKINKDFEAKERERVKKLIEKQKEGSSDG